MTETLTAAPTKAPVNPIPTELTLMDRCDHCGAQAFVAVAVPTAAAELPLLLCGHHYRKHEDALTLSGARVALDKRDTINEKPSVSATAD